MHFKWFYGHNNRRSIIVLLLEQIITNSRQHHAGSISDFSFVPSIRKVTKEETILRMPSPLRHPTKETIRTTFETNDTESTSMALCHHEAHHVQTDVGEKVLPLWEAVKDKNNQSTNEWNGFILRLFGGVGPDDGVYDSDSDHETKGFIRHTT